MKTKSMRNFLIVAIVLIFLIPAIPSVRNTTADAVNAQSLNAGISNEWLQGESVDYEMSISDKVPATITSIISSDGNIFDFGISGAGANDGEVWTIESDTDGTTSVQLNGYFETPYVNLDTFYWEINSEGTQSVLTRWDDIALYPNGAWTLYAWVDNVAGSQVVDSTYVYNDRMEFTLYAASSVIGGSEYVIAIDQFFVSTDNVTGIIRSEYYITDPTSTLHKVSIDCFDYGVDIQVDVPAHWEYQSINPSAAVTDVAGRVIITETVPTTYEIFFTSDDSLRVANARETWSQGFESIGSEYTTVFEGAVSQNMTSEISVNPPTTADYYVAWSHYVGSGSLFVNGTEYNTTGAWESYVVAYASLGRLNFTATDAYLDNVYVYSTLLSSSRPATGMAYHITPYGLYAYQYSTLYGAIAQGTTIITSETLQTSALGGWDFELGLAAAGTYSLYTYTGGNLFDVGIKWQDTFSNTSVWTNYGDSVYFNMTGWDYKRSITLNDTTPMADYQVKLTFTTATLGNPYTNIDATGDDLRFYDSSGVACDYYIMEDWDNTGTSYVWVEVTTSGSTYLTMYYGNSGASAASSIYDTMLLGEDFEDGDYTDTMSYFEDDASSSAIISSGILTLHVVSNNNYIWFTNGFTGSVAIEWRSDGWVSAASYAMEGIVELAVCPSSTAINAPETWTRYYHGSSLNHYDEDESEAQEAWDAGNKDWNDNLMYLTTSYYKDYTDGDLEHSQIADNEVNVESTWQLRKFGNYADYTVDWVFIRRFDGTEIVDSSFDTAKSTHLSGTQTSASGIVTFIGNYTAYGGFNVTGLSYSTTDYNMLNISLRSTYDALNFTLTVDGANYTYNPSTPVASIYYNFSLEISTTFGAGSVTAMYLQDANDAIQNFSVDYLQIYGSLGSAENQDEFTITVQQLGMTGAILTKLSTDTYVLDVTGETYSDQLYTVYLAEDSVLSNTNHAISNVTGWGDMFDNDHTGWGTFRCSITDNPDSVTIETTSEIGSAFIVYNFADDLDVTDVQWLEVHITNLDLGFQLRIRDTDSVEYYPGAFENDNGTYNYNLYDALGATKTIDQITFYTASVIGDHFDIEYIKIYNPYYPDVLVGYGSDGCLIDAVNITGGQHNFVVDAISRQQGNEANGIYYAYITGSVAGEYTVYTESDMYIVFYDQQGNRIDFDLFNVYVNDTQIYHDVYSAYEEYAYNITITDRWDTLIDSNTYDWEPRQEIQLTIYSFKVYSYNNGFIYYNLTLAGSTQYWSEYIAPLEVVEYTLYAETYDWEVFFISNGSSASGTVTLPDATYGDYAQIITDNTVNDLLRFWNMTYITTQTINITANNIYDDTVIIQLMFDWTNTTIYNQTVTIEAMFNWSNTTLYNQTITIANAFNATNTILYQQSVYLLTNITNINSTIHSQLVSVLADVSNVNSTLYAQTVQLLADISNTNTTLYTQTITLLADISNVNSTLYTQTVYLLANVTNMNSTIYDQTVTLLADISSTNSTIHTQIITLLADISNVNSTLYTQTVTLIANLSNVNSTLYAQNIQLLADVSNMNTTIYTQTVSILANITNINSTLYTQTVTILADILNMNTTLYAQSITLLADISNTNATLYNQTITLLADISNVNTTIYNQGIDIINYILTSNSTIYNQTISILNSFVKIYGYSDAPFHLVLEDIRIYDAVYTTFVTNWGNATVTFYNNDTQIGAMVGEGTFIEWVKSKTTGLHLLGFRINSSGNTFWVNTSYTITYLETVISIYSSVDAFGFPDWEDVFKVYVNGSRVYENLYFATSNALNITVLSYWNEVINMTTYTAPNDLTGIWEINIATAMHEMIFANAGINPLRFTLTRNSVIRTFEVGGGGLYPIRLPDADYTFQVEGLIMGNDGEIISISNILESIVKTFPNFAGIITFVDQFFQDLEGGNRAGANLFITNSLVALVLVVTLGTAFVVMYQKSRPSYKAPKDLPPRFSGGPDTFRPVRYELSGGTIKPNSARRKRKTDRDPGFR